MKIKSDFVTNSSSTSFILRFKADTDSKDEFIDIMNRRLEDHIKERGWDEEFQEPPMLKSDMVTSTGEREFNLHVSVPICPDEQDTPPQYIQELLHAINSDAGKLLEQAGVKLITTETKDLNE